MCRVLLYCGEPICISKLLYGPDNALVNQAYAPKQMTGIQNLAGFGMALWQAGFKLAHQPLIYKTTELPFYDNNLKSLAEQLTASCILAHVRGVQYTANQVIIQQNIHPFAFNNTSLVMGHNGSLTGLEVLKQDLFRLMKPDIAAQIEGTTDTEWIYALFLSQIKNRGDEDDVRKVSDALLKALDILNGLREKHRVRYSSPLNLFISNGRYHIVTRYALDYGHFSPETATGHFAYHTLWYTRGQHYEYIDGEYRMMSGKNNDSIIIASEPLTDDITTWVEIPEYSLITAELTDKGVGMQHYDIDI